MSVPISVAGSEGGDWKSDADCVGRRSLRRWLNAAGMQQRRYVGVAGYAMSITLGFVVKDRLTWVSRTAITDSRASRRDQLDMINVPCRVCGHPRINALLDMNDNV